MILLYGAMPTEIAWGWFLFVCFVVVLNLIPIINNIPALIWYILGAEQVDLDSLPDKPVIQKPVQKAEIELKISKPNAPTSRTISTQAKEAFFAAKIEDETLLIGDFLKKEFPEEAKKLNKIKDEKR